MQIAISSIESSFEVQKFANDYVLEAFEPMQTLFSLHYLGTKVAVSLLFVKVLSVSIMVSHLSPKSEDF